MNFSYVISGVISLSENMLVRVVGMQKTGGTDMVELKEVSETVSLGTVTQRSARINLFRIGDL